MSKVHLLAQITFALVAFIYEGKVRLCRVIFFQSGKKLFFLIDLYKINMRQNINKRNNIFHKSTRLCCLTLDKHKTNKQKTFIDLVLLAQACTHHLEGVGRGILVKTSHKARPSRCALRFNRKNK